MNDEHCQYQTEQGALERKALADVQDAAVERAAKEKEKPVAVKRAAALKKAREERNR